MANMFEKYAADREAEQKKIEQTVSEPAAAKQTTVSADAAPAEDEKRTTLSLSLTVSDKKALKMMAAERETTIAAIIHEWVAEHARRISEEVKSYGRWPCCSKVRPDRAPGQ